MPPAEPRAPRSGFGGAAEAAALAVAAEAVVLAIAAGACPVAAAAAACMRSCSCLFRPARLDGSQPAPSRSEPRRRSGGRAPSSLLRADPPPAASRLGTTSLHMQNARLPSGSSMPWFEQNWAKHACWRCSSQPYVEHCRLSARSCSWHSGWRHARSEDRGEDRPRGASVGEDRAETGAKTGAKTGSKTGSKTGAKTAKTGLNISQNWELEQASVCSLALISNLQKFQSASLLETERRHSPFCDWKGRHGRGGSRARVAAPSGNLAQGLPCPARVRRLFLSGRDAILQRSCTTRQDICWDARAAGDARSRRAGALCTQPWTPAAPLPESRRAPTNPCFQIGTRCRFLVHTCL